MREFLFVSSEQRIVIYDIVKNQPLRFITSMGNPNNLIINNNYNYLNYSYHLKQPGLFCLNNIQFDNQLIIDINNDNKIQS